jgi:hypothetical protein
MYCRLASWDFKRLSWNTKVRSVFSREHCKEPVMSQMSVDAVNTIDSAV